MSLHDILDLILGWVFSTLGDLEQDPNTAPPPLVISSPHARNPHKPNYERAILNPK